MIKDSGRDPLAPLFDEERDLQLEAMLDLLHGEVSTLETLLPDALARQWSASPVPKPREDTAQRASGGRPNPTADIVLDDRRLAVRESVERSRRALRDAAVAVRGTRLALERAISRFDGE